MHDASWQSNQAWCHISIQNTPWGGKVTSVMYKENNHTVYTDQL